MTSNTDQQWHEAVNRFSGPHTCIVTPSPDRALAVDVSQLNATFIQRLNTSIANIDPDAITTTDSVAASLGWRAKPCMTGARLLRAGLAAPPSPVASPLSQWRSLPPPPLPSIGSEQGAVAASPHHPPQYTVRFAVGGTCRLEHLWPVVSQVADEVLAQSFARLQLCKCDI